MALQHILRQKFHRTALLTVLILSLLLVYQLVHLSPRDPAIDTNTYRYLLRNDQSLEERSRLENHSHHLDDSQRTNAIGKSLLSSTKLKEYHPSAFQGQAEIANWLVSFVQRGGNGGRREEEEQTPQSDVHLHENWLLEEWREKRLENEEAVHAILQEEDNGYDEGVKEFDKDYQNYLPLEDDSKVIVPKPMPPLVYDTHSIEHPPIVLAEGTPNMHKFVKNHELPNDERNTDFPLDQDKWMEQRRKMKSYRAGVGYFVDAAPWKVPHDKEAQSVLVSHRTKSDLAHDTVSKKARVHYRPKGEQALQNTQLAEEKLGGIRVNRRPMKMIVSKPDLSVGQNKAPLLMGTRKKRSLSKQKMTLDDSQLRLRGFPLKKQPKSVSAHHLSTTWNPSEGVSKRLPVLEAAVNHSLVSGNVKTRDLVNQSMDANILARGVFHQARVSEFCDRNQLSGSLPSKDTDLDTLLQHLLYDDSTKMIYCYVPKNGCSNMKRLMLILNGILPPNSASEKRPAEEVLKEVKALHNLSAEEALYRLNSYMKVLIVRNPLERLLSAYRNKLEPPFNPDNRHFFPDNLKLFIFQRARRDRPSEDVKQWNVSSTWHPKFREFVYFMTLYDLSTYNEHFKPVLDLCYPCAIQYDFFANFKSLDYDVYALMDYLGISTLYYPQAISHASTPTEAYMKEYYSTLDFNTKRKLHDAFSLELQFYYSLHPEEKDMHKHL